MAHDDLSIWGHVIYDIRVNCHPMSAYGKRFAG